MVDLYRSSRTMCVRETQIIPPRPHEIVVSDGVSIFVKEREIKILYSLSIEKGWLDMREILISKCRPLGRPIFLKL